MVITASLLYDFVQCPHRVTMDIYGNPADRDPISPFVELLWERGNEYEKEVIGKLRQPFLDLKALPLSEKQTATAQAMACKQPLIYGGRVVVDDLVGEPDILRVSASGYIAGDIKSGAGEEGAGEESDRKPKKHYAVQLALYTDILERLKFSASRSPFVWDVNGDEVAYDLEAPRGPRTPQSLWGFYQEQINTARLILAKKECTLPASSSTCKLCHWYSSCKKALITAQDLTLIPALGRSRRDALSPRIRTVQQLADAGLAALGKVPGIGPDMLRRFQVRAGLLCDPGAKPFLTEPITFPDVERELFFDVETDPMRDVCYLHGFLERTRDGGTTERYVSFFADEASPDAEREAFSKALAYVRQIGPCAIYHYSAYERTIWRKLQEKYPEVATAEEIGGIFEAESTVDLYLDIVAKRSEWPTNDHSVKTLATYLGFTWRDPTPSGAASIEWYHRWTESRDQTIRQRILEYNEDDCIAMRVLLDGLKALPVRT
ncbi:MAG: TM0106 family RecB-like putative nuclease [Spirochaetes bacterium]|nr:TM0106 family RecB-like putative nuclease [Spirochaetota bacterium]